MTAVELMEKDLSDVDEAYVYPREIAPGQVLHPNRWTLPYRGGYVAIPLRDCDWWSTRDAPQRTCPECGAERADPMTVMAYSSRLDPTGEQQRMHPGWKEKGWLTLRQCDSCGDQWYGGVVDDAQVRKWGAEYGGWGMEGLQG